ncbi:UDP-N-acetylmuramate dehydrogenase [Vibrio crassostreae]|uniref:UDP-N-acetylenolpyruvoylglucosamine reductase n=1 Tax=Vibrio crassostreae TaxID=246167 RepID=A0ABP1WNR9_9VIBR|nr:UDP-N-acetylmuramate dehydrogenase [Vibrio crassostreae]TCL27630.1 UDP-N-acetylmuramate dehydrogenase [Vibrio crassostreae]TCT49005.1 UDP-N-acetylmuramate dehydrogenase [Vibrio crassostreae]TCT58571.1 UDP-N-acetylmuramate dehydrogenase [Vibrio crassostreae]CAK1709429.1 UDP-N-acetylenolpyruvoylglucosamine reductase [Vibrio crassostreae]CAK1711212.1 UDP-N-acetylenolpyruvoylglucosamine reductase [Vibrio crassostreae]
MIEKANVQLRDFNTLKLSSLAEKYFEVKDEEELKKIFSDKISSSDEFRVLGGGSNLWLCSNKIANVIKMNNLGTRIKKTKKKTYLFAKAGENWSKLVEMSVSNKIGGLENLIDIPGNVGAAPVQNIGAYGTEVGEFIKEITVFDTKTKEFKVVQRDECSFKYRDSIFKKNQSVIITEVVFEFDNDYKPEITNRDILRKLGEGDNEIKNILSCVREIRNSKIPNPKSYPNSGSFFKNPIISKEQLSEIIKINKKVVYYEVANGFKLSAAWLIENAGWKGKLIDGIGMSSIHSLIFVNTSNNKLIKIDDYINNLKSDIYRKFRVELEIEPIRW